MNVPVLSACEFTPSGFRRVSWSAHVYGQPAVLAHLHGLQADASQDAGQGDAALVVVEPYVQIHFAQMYIHVCHGGSGQAQGQAVSPFNKVCRFPCPGARPLQRYWFPP